MRIIEHKKKKGLCVAYRCFNRHGKRDRFCHKHSKRYQKETNFLNYTYHAIKCNAKRRGKKFTITLEEFKTFCESNDYLKRKGRKASNLSIDRIDSTKGYEVGNLQILTVSENSKKSDTDCPF